MSSNDGTWVMRAVCMVTIHFLGIIHIARTTDCSSQCLDCSSDGRCRHCNSGYYGVMCIPCSSLCKNSQCVMDLCSEGCVEGRYGYSCDKNCSYCPHGCDQWRGSCDVVGSLALPTLPYRGEKDAPLHPGYKLLIGLLVIGAVGIIGVVGVLIKGRRSRKRRLVSRNSKRRNKRRLSMNRVPEAPIWKTADGVSPSEMTSTFTIEPTTPIAETSADSVQETERIPILLNSRAGIQIVVSPPSSSSAQQENDLPNDQLNFPLLH